MSESKLLTMINSLVEEKTFSADAVDAIAELRKAAKANEERIELLKDELKSMKENYDTLENMHRETQEKLVNACAEREGFRDRVAKTEKIDTERRIAEAKHTVLEGVFGTIFRNTQVHRSVTSSLPVTHPSHIDQFGTQHTEYTDVHQTREDIVEESK